MKLLVCGSRTYSDRECLFRSLDGLRAVVQIDELIEGGADGADKLARSWAASHGIPFRTFHADWDRHGKAAGPIRNEEMLIEGQPDIVVAFYDKPRPESRGTSHMVRIARYAGVETHEVGPS